MRRLALGALVALTACGSDSSGHHDATPPPDDASLADASPMIDGGPPPPDAGPDAGPTAVRPARELDSAGGRVTGGGLVLDLQLGHAIEQRPVTGGGLVLEGAAVVKP